MSCLSGPIVIERVSISVAKFEMLLGRGIAKYRSRGPDSATLNEGMSSSVKHMQHPALTSHSHIVSAARNPIGLDDKQVEAVAARIELDLRIGFAFTRFLTLNLRPLGGPMSELTLSYGKPDIGC